MDTIAYIYETGTLLGYNQEDVLSVETPREVIDHADGTRSLGQASLVVKFKPGKSAIFE